MASLQSWRDRTLAAPGTDIWSTTAQGQHDVKSGTSFAAPMVTGIATRCFAAGECKFGDAQAGGGAANMKRILDAALTKWTYDPEFAWNSRDGKTWTVPEDPKGTDAYYGLLAWAGKW